MKNFDQDKALADLGRILLSSAGRSKLRDRFVKAGFEDIPYKSVGAMFVGCILLTFVWYIYVLIAARLYQFGFLFLITSFVLLVTGFAAIILFSGWVLLRMYLEVKSYARTQDIEQNLPMFLREFATNLKAGREFVDALEDSLTPQLGTLNDDISKLVVDIRSGVMTEKVLKDYSQRYDSYAINETFEIILEAYQGGGGLSDIIDKIAENLEVIHYLKRNAIASVSNYIIFTSIVSLMIAPLLFALSNNLLELINQLVDNIALSGGTPGFFGRVRQLDISFSDFKMFSRASIAVISGSAASIIGIIRKGSMKGAPVLLLVYILISLLIYEFDLWLLEWIFIKLQLLT